MVRFLHVGLVEFLEQFFGVSKPPHLNGFAHVTHVVLRGRKEAAKVTTAKVEGSGLRFTLRAIDCAHAFAGGTNLLRRVCQRWNSIWHDHVVATINEAARYSSLIL